MKYRVTVEWKDCDERDVVRLRAADPATACAEAVRRAEDGLLRTVSASWDPEPAYVTAVSDADGRSLPVPKAFEEGAVHLGEDWPKAHAAAVLVREMKLASADAAGSSQGVAIDVVLRTFLGSPMEVATPPDDQGAYSVVVAWLDKANVLEIEVEAESVAAACAKAVEAAADGGATLVDFDTPSEVFVLALVEGDEPSAAEVIEHSLDVPAPWSEGWRLHAGHLRALELFDIGLVDPLQAFRIAASGREDLLAHVARAEAAFAAIPSPSTVSAAPSI